MYYNDLVTIKYEPIEVAHNKRKSEAFRLHSCTIDELNKKINKRVESLKEVGMTLFTLEFSSSEDDDGTPESWCRVQGSRMETGEEMQERIARHEKYNEKVREQRAKDKEQSDRRKEIKRLTEHLTLDQLKAIESISP